jgi:uncharacterized OsmC-like protein
MVKTLIEYKGDLRCEIVHEPSGTKIITDAPKDNHGKGESFSPTDLCATSLGSCIATTMGIYAARHDIDLKGLRVTVEKHMSSDTPRRIVKLATEIWMPVPKNEALERITSTCPVHYSLHPDIEKPVVFHWKE